MRGPAASSPPAPATFEDFLRRKDQLARLALRVGSLERARDGDQLCCRRQGLIPFPRRATATFRPVADNFPVRWQTIFPSLGSHFSRQGQAKSLVLFLGGAGESAVVAYMKVARRRAAVRMHPLTGPGAQVGQWLGFFIDCRGQLKSELGRPATRVGSFEPPRDAEQLSCRPQRLIPPLRRERARNFFAPGRHQILMSPVAQSKSCRSPSPKVVGRPVQNLPVAQSRICRSPSVKVGRRSGGLLHRSRGQLCQAVGFFQHKGPSRPRAGKWSDFSSMAVGCFPREGPRRLRAELADGLPRSGGDVRALFVPAQRRVSPASPSGGGPQPVSLSVNLSGAAKKLH